MAAIWSTCRSCGEAMRVYQEPPEAQSTHPCCPDAPSYSQRLLRDMWAAAMVEDFDTMESLARDIGEHESRPVRMESAALAYRDWGWPVFPLRDGGKLPWASCFDCRRARCPGPESCGHNLCHGCKDATRDTATIERWWREYPHANVGLATGYLFDVIDVDVPHGVLHWAELRDSGRCPDVHGWTSTPSGGFHLLVGATGHGNAANVRPGIDYRGRGGYVVAPPSIRADCGGRRYRWVVMPSPLIKWGRS